MDKETEILRLVAKEVAKAIKGKSTLDVGIYVGALFHAAVTICYGYGVSREEMLERVGEHYDRIRTKGSN
jgi:hypothetical protein